MRIWDYFRTVFYGRHFCRCHRKRRRRFCWRNHRGRDSSRYFAYFYFVYFNFMSNINTSFFWLQQGVSMNNKQYIDLNYVVDLKNYQNSLQKWLTIRKINQPQTPINEEQLYTNYLPVVKPVVHRFSQLCQSLSPKDYGFFSSLPEPHLQIIRKNLKPLEQFQIVHSGENIQKVQQNEVEKLLENKFPPIFKINLKEHPSNDQLQWWFSFVQVPQISITSEVIKGKGEGAKSLGMPTANLHVSQQMEKDLAQYPNGIYLVNFEFENGDSYQGAGCLGTNPHYQNLKESRRIQIYVIHDFGDEKFYGSIVKVDFKKLIRFEAKFYSFDAFLNAMHNDIEVCKSFTE